MFRGHSFKGQNLAGANFSYADLSSADFTGANLQGANFTGAKAGLQKRWGLLLVVVSWLLSGISGFLFLFNGILIAYMFDPSQRIENQVSGSIVLIVTIIVYVIIIPQGIGVNLILVALLVYLVAYAVAYALTVAGAGAGAVAVSFALAFGLAFAGAGALVFALTFAVAVAVAGAVAGAVAVAVAVAVAGAVAYAGVEALTIALAVAVAGAFPFAYAVPVSVAVAGTGSIISAYVAWRAMKGDNKYALIHDVAVGFAVIGGTSFRDADLTDANFTSAKLKSTDLRGATLTRTSWHQAKNLDLVRPGESYLKNKLLRQLLITGEGQNQNFDHQDLRGVNFQGANLSYTSFIDTDLSQANLQEAILFEAKLVQTNLDRANLSNANLTAAYIEDWGITRNTIFDGVKGKYVYQKLPTKYNRDPNRMPPSEQGNFSENDLYIFITSVLDTLDLYHRQNINANVAVTVLKGLTKNYPVQFELVGLEKRGENQFVIHLKVFGQASHFQLQREYYARYEQTLPLYDPKRLMSDTDVVVAKMMKKVEENPSTHIENLNNKGIVITGGKVDMSGERNIKAETYLEQSGKLGIGHVSGGKFKDNVKIAAEINEAEKQNLADAATEIQQLLEQLSKTYPTSTNREKMAVVGEAVDQIESNPTLKAKVINALKAGGTEAFKEAVNHPLVNILVATIEGWQDAE